MSKAKRIHPIMSVIQTGKRLRAMIVPLIAFFLSVGKHGIEGVVASLVFGGVLVVFTVITGILSWLTFTYSLEEDELRIKFGVFIRKKRYIPFERIQSINLTEGILQRLFGLVMVQIETAGGEEEAEAVLSAVTKEEARLIQDYVAKARGKGKSDTLTAPRGEVIYKMTLSQLLLHSITSSGVGVVFSALLAVLSQLDDIIPYKKIMGGLEKWVTGSLVTVIVFIIVGFILAWVVSLGLTMLKLANFTVEVIEEDIIITQGLVERRQMTIPLNRIQAVRISENFLRQLFGYGTVFVESAGGSKKNQEGANVMLLPIVKSNQIRARLSHHLPGYIFTDEFNPAPLRALWRYILRAWYFGIPVVILSIIVLKLWGLFSLMLLGILTWWAYLKYCAAGWNLNPDQLSIRYRHMSRSTVFMRRNKIQSMDIRESYFQGKRNLSTIEANVKSGAGVTGGAVVDLEKKDVLKIYRWFSRNNL